MKRRFLLISSIVILMVVVSSMMFACSSSSDVLEGKEYDKQVAYYESIKADVIKNEPLLTALLSSKGNSSWSATFVSTRVYYPTSSDNKVFKGDAVNGGYNKNGSDKDTPWYTQAITYTIKYKQGDVYIVADVHELVDSDSFSATKLPAVKETKKYLKTSTVEEGEVTLYNATIGIMKGDLSDTELLEKYVSNIDSGFRLVTSIMQYQVVRPYAYTEDGGIDTSKVIDYTQNLGKTKYSKSTGDLSEDKYTYFDEYSDDINYNFNKISEVHNERVTLTYNKSKSLLKSYEYLEEIVLPYYAIKDDFNQYNVLKCRVADYTHWAMEFDYETQFTLPSNL